MSARQKINSLYATGVLAVAAVVGGATHSWSVFWLTTIGFAVVLIHGGNIRPVSKSHGRRR